MAATEGLVNPVKTIGKTRGKTSFPGFQPGQYSKALRGMVLRQEIPACQQELVPSGQEFLGNSKRVGEKRGLIKSSALLLEVELQKLAKLFYAQVGCIVRWGAQPHGLLKKPDEALGAQAPDASFGRHVAVA